MKSLSDIVNDKSSAPDEEDGLDSSDYTEAGKAAVAKFFAAGSKGDFAGAFDALTTAVSLCSQQEEPEEEDAPPTDHGKGLAILLGTPKK